MKKTPSFSVLLPPLLLALVSSSSSAGYAPLVDLFGQPGGEEQKCSGAQMVRTNSSLLVWGICGGGAGVKNRTVWLRKSTDWGVSWGKKMQQPHLGAGDLAQVSATHFAQSVLLTHMLCCVRCVLNHQFIYDLSLIHI